MIETDITVATLVQRAVLAIRSATHPLLRELHSISAALQESSVASLAAPQRSAFDFIAELVIPFLERQSPLIEGVGIAYSPGAFVDHSSWLDWWSCRDNGRPVYVPYDLDPRSISFYDYASREWFQAARELGSPVAIGPYVDARGTFVNTVRLAIPVSTASGTHTLGCDLSLAQLESLFVQAVAAVQPALALVGGGGRVLASNSARHAPGTRAAETWASWPVFAEEDEFATVWTIRAPNQAGKCAIRRNTSRVIAGVSGVAERAT